MQIARSEKKARSVELENNDDFGGNSSLIGRCKEEHRFLKSVVEKVTRLSLGRWEEMWPSFKAKNYLKYVLSAMIFKNVAPKLTYFWTFT